MIPAPLREIRVTGAPKEGEGGEAEGKDVIIVGRTNRGLY